VFVVSTSVGSTRVIDHALKSLLDE
jgi:hypothetical protein